MSRRLLSSGVVAAMLSVLLVGSPALSGQAAATSEFNLSRIAGSDRYATAAAIATSAFASGADKAIIATGEDFPDALAGSFLAGNLAGPVLLTRKDTLSSSAKSALSTLKTKSVTILGGTGAVSQAVENELEATNSTASGGGKLTVDRVAGANRYATARLIGTDSRTTVGSVGGKKTAIIARGELFPDALAGGAPAYASKLPVLTTPGGSAKKLGADAKTALVNLAIEQVLILGGTGAISTETENEIKNARGTGSITTVRLQGADRTETARAIAEYAITSLTFVKTLANLARGDGFADALAGGVYGGSKKSPVLLTVSATKLSNSDTTGAKKYLRDHSDTLTGGAIFGGSSAVSSAVETEAEAAGRADATRPKMTSAAANSNTERVVVQYDEEVKCADSSATRGQFSYAGAVPSTPSAITCDSTKTVILTFTNVTGGGNLTYTDDNAATDDNDVVDLNGNPAQSPQTVAAVADTTGPTMVSAAITNTATNKSLAVTWNEAITCTDSSTLRGKFEYDAANPDNPSKVTCSGSIATLVFDNWVNNNDPVGDLVYTDATPSSDAGDIRDLALNSAPSSPNQRVTGSLGTPPKIDSAVVLLADDTVTLTYSDEVTCAEGAASQAQFSFSGATPSAPTAVDCDTVTTDGLSKLVTLTFGEVTGAGTLTYTQSSSNKAARIKGVGANKNYAQSPQTIAASVSGFAMTSATSSGMTITVTWSKTIVCPGDAQNALTFRQQFDYTGSALDPATYSCTGAVLTLNWENLPITSTGQLEYTPDEPAEGETDFRVRDTANPPNHAGAQTIAVTAA